MPSYRLVSFSGDHAFDLPSGRGIVVGRGVTSDIAVYDPTISRVHAELAVAGDGVQVKDLGSSNGTYINGSRISAGRLGPGDSITFGKVLFQLELTRPSAGAFVPPVAPPAGSATIVRQLAVQGVGLPAAIVGVDGASGKGQLRLAEVGAEKRLARKLSLLLDISQKLSGEFDLDRILGTVIETVFEVMSVDRVSILLRNESTGELVPRLSRSRLGDAEFQHVPRSISRKAVEERVAILTDNAATDSRFTGSSIMMQSVRSAMCSPLMASTDRVLGLLYVDNLTSTSSFSDEDLQFLVAFSGLAAVAIKNSQYADQVRREALVRSNFERYFAPNVAAEIAQQTGAATAGGDKRAMTVLFSDIRGFTTLSETMGPDEIAELLSDYFTEMVDIIFEHGGTLDKFIGDAIMALWGAPVAHEDDPDRALRGAIAMQRALGPLNAKWTAAGRPSLAVGIGLNYGEVFAGNIGSHRRLEYTVIGDAVNIASRLCAHAGPGEVLVSESLLAVLRDPADVERLEEISLKGKARPVPVYRVRMG